MPDVALLKIMVWDDTTAGPREEETVGVFFSDYTAIHAIESELDEGQTHYNVSHVPTGGLIAAFRDFWSAARYAKWIVDCERDGTIDVSKWRSADQATAKQAPSKEFIRNRDWMDHGIRGHEWDSRAAR